MSGERKMKSKSPGILSHARSLVIDHLFALLISLVATNIINFFTSDGIPVLQFIICVLVYFSICYVDSWHRGASDGNRMRLGVIPNDKLRGFYAGLIASIPGFILALLAFLAETGAVAFYDVFGVDIATTINRLWQLPLSSLYRFANDIPALNFAFPLFLPVVSEFGYILGLHEFSLKRIFIYRNTTDDDE